MLAERSNPTEQEVYAGRLAEETNKMCIRDRPRPAPWAVCTP